jgi:hydroxymethylglutaryl-CoA lyase
MTVRIVEVGPRDGLQNEKLVLPLEKKVELIQNLFALGFQEIEIGSFVRKEYIPQLADTEELIAVLSKIPNFPLDSCWVLVPNKTGLSKAQSLGMTKLAFFTSVSETFCKKNMNMSVDESFKQIEDMYHSLTAEKVRCYISMAFGCAYEGQSVTKNLEPLIQRLYDLGIRDLSLGDTIGIASPSKIKKILEPLINKFGPDIFTLHLHDTTGMGLLNASCAYQLGIRSFDSSFGGLGGCPYSKVNSGNLATEDLLNYFYEEELAALLIDLGSLSTISAQMCELLKRPLNSKSALYYIQQKKRLLTKV